MIADAGKGGEASGVQRLERCAIAQPVPCGAADGARVVQNDGFKARSRQESVWDVPAHEQQMQVDQQRATGRPSMPAAAIQVLSMPPVVIQGDETIDLAGVKPLESHAAFTAPHHRDLHLMRRLIERALVLPAHGPEVTLAGGREVSVHHRQHVRGQRIDAWGRHWPLQITGRKKNRWLEWRVQNAA